MEFKVGDFTIRFEYYTYNPPERVGHDAFASHATVCEIHDAYYDSTVRDVAYCSTGDIYDQQLGEEISLERAIDLMELDDESISIIWNEYYK